MSKKVNHVIASVALLGVLVSGQGVAQAATSTSEQQPAMNEMSKSLDKDMMQDDMKKDDMMQDDMKKDGMMQDDMKKDGMKKDDMMQDDMKKDGMMQDDMKKDGMMQDDMKKDDMMQDDMKKDGMMQNGMMKDDMKKDGMMKSEMKMLPDTGEENHTNIILTAGMLILGAALSILGFKRKNA
ncbi:LPXTG cell wall anchor domain-containing protein [Macrococcoides goetzii]|uniref:LPXTG cell wall anchor domain-containing protein n=1 Tax=Macrococcoides goetzii TaxID=1891097 RepID=A0A395GBB4_9STAP|nr:LPXTG cell wall anchor domain-containing protein [Macrococcus goetzii]RAI81098.1 LPXTG cell wall anchor domain-containing protein [Macrococcus goetzii]